MKLDLLPVLLRRLVAISSVFGLCACGSSASTAPASDAGPAVQPPTVETEQGPVDCSPDRASHVWSCKGIPYASAPVHALRWRAPTPPPKHAQAIDGSKYGPGCVQSGSGGLFFMSSMPTSEDCLSLNVWFPESATRGALPVMVWIHGGGFILGSGSQALYDGTNLATRDVVMVTINYRLGPLGWMAHGGLVHEDPRYPGAGNYGLLDQIAALTWVRNNIAAFGGDPHNVTVFGESAGGVSVCSLLASPLAKGLFVRAIIQSGICLTGAEMLPLSVATGQGDRVAKALGCDAAADVVACMRAQPAATVAAALPTGILPGVAGQEGWLPIVDGTVEPTTAADALRAGASSQVPILLGINADEGPVLVSGSGLNDLAGVTTFLQTHIGDASTMAILANYPPARYGGSSNAAAYAIVGDGLMLCPAERAAEDFAAKGGKVSAYEFTYVTTYGVALGWGAFHGSDLPFVFRNADLQPGVSLSTFTGSDGTVADWFEGYWTQMARSGSPGTVKEVAWPLFTGPGGMVLHLAPQSAPVAGWPHAADCAVWKATVGSLL